MEKRLRRKSLLVAPQGELGVAGLINKVQQQLSVMEKKLDILISQSSKRPFEKSYSRRPSRPFDQFPRHNRGRQGNGPMGNSFRERTFTRAICSDCNKECEIPFKPSGGRPVYCKECFSKRRKGDSFNTSRNNRPKKRQRPAKKEPFYARIKNRA